MSCKKITVIYEGTQAFERAPYKPLAIENRVVLNWRVRLDLKFGANRLSEMNKTQLKLINAGQARDISVKITARVWS